MLQAAQDRCVTISYADLLDREIIVRTGDPLGVALRDPSLRGAVQPFVDRYSSLLQPAVQMLNGPDDLPHTDVVDHFPPGSAQPAWVAIFRGGRIHLVADGRDHVRVFLLGDTPEAAYEHYYSVIHHCLNGLIPSDGHPLTVEVFAYTNDYAASELRLNTRGYEVSGTSFPSEKVPLDLAALAGYFRQNPILQGAQLSRSEGLVLYGTEAIEPPSLDGHDVSMPDFAVAYRAAFHAGDNDAFISLDPHRDPTKATVNFGGFLEDTHLGSVVLEADKRFKTITSGIDPDSRRDLRQHTRRYVPSFMPVSERDLMSEGFDGTPEWIGTRFWFYPDETGVDTDLNSEFAVVTRPQFTADAERSRDDFESPDEFERKKALLSPGIRQNIDDLNSHYSQYARAYAELTELTTVARLMGVASWLKEADPQWLDLDALLAVELPAQTTPRERMQLLSVSVLNRLPADRLTLQYVRANTRIVDLTPMLDSSLRSYFRTPDRLAAYLCIARGVDEAMRQTYRDEASRLLAARGGDRLRDIITTRDELKALAEYAGGLVDAPQPPALRALHATITRDETTLDRLEAEINAVQRQMAVSPSAHNELLDRHNRLVDQFNATSRRCQENIEAYNQRQAGDLQVVQISGGINLEPRNFRINRTRSSPRLTAFRDVVRSVGGQGRLRLHDATWIRSRRGTTTARLEVASLPRLEWEMRSAAGREASSLAYASAPTGEKAWRMTEDGTGTWRSLLRKSPSQYREESYQPEQRQFRAAEFDSGRVVEHLIAQVEGDRIVFRRAAEANLLPPQEPPLWWQDAQPN